jgi:uncharacterized repeat protein (TIGR02543 family)
VFEIVGGKAIEGVKNFFANRSTSKVVKIDDQDPTLKRAWIFLEDGDFGQAIEYANKTLDKNPELGSAYLVLLLGELQEATLLSILENKISIDELESHKHYQRARKYASQSTNEYIEESLKRYQLTIEDKDMFENSLKKISQDAYSGDIFEYEQTIAAMRTREFPNKITIINNAEKKLLNLKIKKNEIEISSLLENNNVESYILAFHNIQNINDSQIKKAVETLFNIKLEANIDRFYTEAQELALNSSGLKDLSNSLEILYVLGDYKDTMRLIAKVESEVNTIRKQKKNKRLTILISSIVSIILVSSLVYFFTAPLNSLTIDDMHFVKENDEYILKHYSGKDSIVIIPSELRGLPITKIEENAFLNNENIESITIPESVTEIGENAFLGTTNLSVIEYTFRSDLSVYFLGLTEYDLIVHIDNEDTMTYSFNIIDLIDLPVFAREGYAFNGWYDNADFIGDEVSEISSGTIGDIILYAKWSINTYDITFIENQGTNVNDISNQDYGTEIDYPETTREGYTFEGWYLNNELTELFTSETVVATDITLYAKWATVNYGITYNLDDGMNSANPSMYTIETETILFSDATKEGYTFNGWYDNADFIGDEVSEISSGTTGDIILYAKWSINTYDITFIENQGTNVNDISNQDYGTEIDYPETTREGYTFEGWYLNNELTELFASETIIASDITLYAKWNIFTYNVTYLLDGGTNHINNPDCYTVVTPTILLEEPTKEGYTFIGWYDNAEFTGDEVTEISSGTIGDITLYASWSINQYTISYSVIKRDYDPLQEVILFPNETIVEVSLGSWHSVALTSDGRVFTWGQNTSGQLGDGTTVSRQTPVDITSLFDLYNDEYITNIDLGGAMNFGGHSAALTSDGRVFTWGDNNYGQLGDGTTTDRLIPKEITYGFSLNDGETITQISLGSTHSAALTSDGRVFTWGHNSLGQLGDGTTINSNSPIDITAQFLLGETDNIANISLGTSFSSAISINGQVFTWGYRDSGQLGNGATGNGMSSTPINITNNFALLPGENVNSITLGGAHAIALTSHGNVFVWGRNNSSQLGDGTTTNKYKPFKITTFFNFNFGEVITDIDLGYEHSIAVTSDGRVFTWGDNNYGQLGDGTTTDRITPYYLLTMSATQEYFVSAGFYHTAVYPVIYGVQTVGNNNWGQCGLYFNTPELIKTVNDDFNTTLDYIPVLEGYTFDGWYYDPELSVVFTDLAIPAEDLILYGKWIPND